MRAYIEAVARTLIASYSSEELHLDVLAASAGISRRRLQQYFTSPRAVELALIESPEHSVDDELYDLLCEQDRIGTQFPPSQ